MRSKFYRWLSWRVPRKLVYWCAVRLLSRASFHYCKNIDSITASMALKSWNLRVRALSVRPGVERSRGFFLPGGHESAYHSEIFTKPDNVSMTYFTAEYLANTGKGN